MVVPRIVHAKFHANRLRGFDAKWCGRWEDRLILILYSYEFPVGMTYATFKLKQSNNIPFESIKHMEYGYTTFVYLINKTSVLWTDKRKSLA